MKKIVLIVALMSGGALANDWSGPTNVVDIYAGYKDGTLLFTTSDPHINPNGCFTSYYTVREGDADLSIILSVLLAAQKSGAKIHVGVDADACDASGRISVTRVRSIP